MASFRCFQALFAIITLLIPPATSQSLLRLPGGSGPAEDLFCESWKFSAETQDAGSWKVVPARCKEFVEAYMTGERYASDSDVVAAFSAEFARGVEIADDGKDAWIFDVDETLLSNLPYYEVHQYGHEPFDETQFHAWVDLGEASALQASLRLYDELKMLGFKLFLLTGRDEEQRIITEKNLLSAGYSGWERLILRGPADHGKAATAYKSERRSELVKEGYRIHGSSGDQWSDLHGFAVARRSFKLPNPMYYIP